MTDKKLFICEEVKIVIRENSFGQLCKFDYYPIREYDATEAEQLRKERDDFKNLYDEMVDRYTELTQKVSEENGNV